MFLFEWLPADEEDTRATQGRNKSGNRKYIFGRTGSEDEDQNTKLSHTDQTHISFGKE